LLSTAFARQDFLGNLLGQHFLRIEQAFLAPATVQIDRGGDERR
jgi:hypothetical protein